jgi:hypothetical protein
MICFAKPGLTEDFYIVKARIFNNMLYARYEHSEIHNVNTRTKYDLHHPLSQLSVFQKGVYYTGIKVFNSLPVTIKDLSHNIKEFKAELENFLLSYSFYTLDEYFKGKN